MRTHHSEQIINTQLDRAMSNEQAVLFAYTEQGGDVFMVDASGQSIYDAAAQADEIGVWVFLGHAISSDQVNYGQDWQQNPSINHDMPDDVALGVPEKASQLSTGAKWLIGGLTTVGMFVLGAAINDGETHHHDHHVHAHSNSIPQPNALVQQFSSAQNPENPNERAVVVQAEPQKSPNPTVETEALLNQSIALPLNGEQIDFDALSETSPAVELEYIHYHISTLPTHLLNQDATTTEPVG